MITIQEGDIYQDGCFFADTMPLFKYMGAVERVRVDYAVYKGSSLYSDFIIFTIACGYLDLNSIFDFDADIVKFSVRLATAQQTVIIQNCYAIPNAGVSQSTIPDDYVNQMYQGKTPLSTMVNDGKATAIVGEVSVLRFISATLPTITNTDTGDSYTAERLSQSHPLSEIRALLTVGDWVVDDVLRTTFHIVNVPETDYILHTIKFRNSYGQFENIIVWGEVLDVSESVNGDTYVTCDDDMYQKTHTMRGTTHRKLSCKTGYINKKRIDFLKDMVLSSEVYYDNVRCSVSMEGGEVPESLYSPKSVTLNVDFLEEERFYTPT